MKLRETVEKVINGKPYTRALSYGNIMPNRRWLKRRDPDGGGWWD